MTRAIDPRTGEPFGPDHPDASESDLDTVVRRADAAATALRALAPDVIAGALRSCADELRRRKEDLVEIADAETALGEPRLPGEVDRTANQLLMFADLVESGAHLDAVVDRLPEGGPARDVRRVNVPIGVVAVFGASNFPFAFGVAGGDTASALAAGCAVVAKAHPAHPGTCEAVADAVRDALSGAGLPDDAFQLVHGAEPAVGAALVRHERVAAVGFTGSTAGGRALFDLGASRPRPIPVYAEQGSLNPVVLAPSAVRPDRVADVAAKLAGAVSQGWGQFCTKPGVIAAPADRTREFVSALTGELAGADTGFLLTPGVRDTFHRRVDEAAAVPGVEAWRADGGEQGLTAPATVLTTDAATFRDQPALREEMFGPATVVVAVEDGKDVATVVEAVGGSLTGTVHGDTDDPWVAEAVEELAGQAGRVLSNGVPTGVAVVPAMHHGGPYPASTFPQHTSVGTAAIRRFLRPVAYQDFADELLPRALADGNPWGIERVVDGRRTSDRIDRG